MVDVEAAAESAGLKCGAAGGRWAWARRTWLAEERGVQTGSACALWRDGEGFWAVVERLFARLSWRLAAAAGCCCCCFDQDCSLYDDTLWLCRVCWRPPFDLLGSRCALGVLPMAALSSFRRLGRWISLTKLPKSCLDGCGVCLQS
jgi:hypothetical protein